MRSYQLVLKSMLVLLAFWFNMSCTWASESADVQQPSGSGQIAMAAQRAKAAGRSAITLDVTIPEEHGPTLEERLRSYSVALVAPLSLSAIQTATDNDIYTWHTFSVVEWLIRRAPVSSDYCNIRRPSTLALSSSSITVPVLGGSVTVDGVEVTLTSNKRPPPFTPGKTYLFVGIDCPEAFNLPYAADNLFRVEPDGSLALITISPLDREPWARTIEDVRRKLKTQ